MKYLAALLRSRHSTQIILLLTLLLTSPALVTGYFGDDYMHHALLSPGEPFPKPDDWSLFGLFSFANGDPVRNQMLRDYSLIPWWTYDGLKYAFWRPVSELTHWVDHRLWHEQPALMHAQNLAWYLVLCSLVGLSFRKLSTTPLAATCALAIYALDSTHGFGVGWISNRNALLAATFGVASLLTYIRWRESLQLRFSLASLALLALSLLSAEAGISTTAYLGAYALILDRKGPFKGLLALLPHATLTVFWWVTYKHLGFGAANADSYYVDPTASPLLFLLKLVERLPVLLASQFGLVPAEVYGFSGRTIPVYVGVCALFVCGVFALLWGIVRQQPTARFWLLGSLFALAPIATALPHDRNLFFVGIGASLLLGELFQRCIATPFSSRLVRGLAVTLLAIHLVASPLLLPLSTYSPKIWSNHMSLNAIQLPALEGLESSSVVLLGAPLPAALGMIPIRYAEKLPLPAHLWTATTLREPLTLTRLSAHEITLSLDKGFVTGVEEALRNTQTFPFVVGDKVSHSGMTLEVVHVNDSNKPTKIALRFDEHTIEKVVFLQWRDGSYHLVPLPPINESVQVTWRPTQPAT